jgi:probable rRNA maturation factor
MQSPLTSTLAVEVNVQDVFSANLSKNSKEKNDLISPSIWQNWFQIWLEILDPNLGQNRSYELSLRLTDDLEMQGLNAQFRDKNQPTDVLAFAALEIEVPQPSEAQLESEPLYLGDIVISVETATRQSQQQKHSLETELAWLASHGLLHLLGWDHPNEESLIAMLYQQESLLKAIGLNLATGIIIC